MRTMIVSVFLCSYTCLFCQINSNTPKDKEKKIEYRVISELTNKIDGLDTLVRVGILIMSDSLSQVDVNIHMGGVKLCSRKLSEKEISDAKQTGVIWLGEFNMAHGAPVYTISAIDKKNNKRLMTRKE